MKKLRKLVLLAVTVMVIGGTLTAHAEEAFDATYYAQTNPDVVQAVGMDANALYQHYVTFGKAEGRKGTPDTSVSTPTTGVNTFVPTAQADFTKYNAELQVLANDVNTFNLAQGYIVADSIATVGGAKAQSSKMVYYSECDFGLGLQSLSMYAFDDNHYEIVCGCDFRGTDFIGRPYAPYNEKALRLFTKMIGDNDGSLASWIVYDYNIDALCKLDTWTNAGIYQVKCSKDNIGNCHYSIRPIQ